MKKRNKLDDTQHVESLIGRPTILDTSDKYKREEEGRKEAKRETQVIIKEEGRRTSCDNHSGALKI